MPLPFEPLWKTNCTLDLLYGVDSVGDILERNRGVRVARKQQVMTLFFFDAQLMFVHSAFALLWFCSG